MSKWFDKGFGGRRRVIVPNTREITRGWEVTHIQEEERWGVTPIPLTGTPTSPPGSPLIGSLPIVNTSTTPHPGINIHPAPFQSLYDHPAVVKTSGQIPSVS